jgi:type I restriction enzyme R subunit
LTPFKVNQIATTLDDYLYAPDDKVLVGEVEPGKRYAEADFNKIIEIKEREAYRVQLFMNLINPQQKTLVFCATQTHALAVRDLINQLKTSSEPNYCVRVTADDGALGEQFLRTFQDNEKTIPTILTTSQKLSTGVDARNIRNIVLMRAVNSMIEFKQIIGRGTRLFDGKDYFTIYDFVQAYKHFNDPEWDGEPLEPDPCPECENHPCSCLKEPCAVCGNLPCSCPCENCGERPCVCPCPECGEKPCACQEKPKKIIVKLADGKERVIQHMLATTFWNPDGTQISAAQFIEHLYGELPALFKDEDELRAIWGQPEIRKKLLDALAEKGIGDEQFDEIRSMIQAEQSDVFDLLAYVAFTLPPISRKERVAAHKSAILTGYEDKQRLFLEFVLGEYIKEGIGELELAKLPGLLELQYGNTYDAAEQLGGAQLIKETFVGFQRHLYARQQ